MKTTIYIFLALILGQAGCYRADGPSLREARTNLLAQIELTQQAIQKKERMLQPLVHEMPAMKFNCLRKGVKELQNIQRALLLHEKRLDDLILSYKPEFSEAERQTAYQHNTRLEFDISPELSVDNLVKIVESIEGSEVLDPRILSIRITGTNTVEVETGKTIGLCVRAGDLVYLEQTNGEWIINDVASWGDCR